MHVGGMDISHCLGVSEREKLNKEIKHYENLIASAKDTGLNIHVIPSWQISIGMIKTKLNAFTPRVNNKPIKLSPNQRDALNARKKKLEARLREVLPTEFEMHRGNARDVEKNYLYKRNHEHMAVEYKQVMRALDPDDSITGNIENLRTQGFERGEKTTIIK